MWRDLKYLLAYIIPFAAAQALYSRGLWSFNGITVAFVMVPLIEIFMKGSTQNLTESEEETQQSKVLFDILLYLNVPMLLGLLIWYFYTITYIPIQLYERIGLTLTLGIYVGGVGINVAHELGHRSDWLPQQLARLLLLPNLYLHFLIEHNHGHHVHIATPEDPASSRYGETLYAFYVRSVINSYRSAWQIETKRLKRAKISFWSWQNQMLGYQIAQVAWVVGLGLIFGWQIIPYVLIVAVLGFLMLETVNYIEHYGLQRRQLASGRYEPVQPWHSWNCNHDLGRILLYELTRHSDHHYKANRKYQVLRHFDKAPQLPWGYPSAMLISLVPPLWFKLMNPKVAYYKQQIPELV